MPEPKYPVCSVCCPTCKRVSARCHVDEQKGWVNAYGWATCEKCRVVIDPDHPDAPPVVPFPLAERAVANA